MWYNGEFGTKRLLFHFSHANDRSTNRRHSSQNWKWYVSEKGLKSVGDSKDTYERKKL